MILLVACLVAPFVRGDPTPPAATPATPATPAVGDKAPDFTLDGIDGKSVKLTDFTQDGPVVLIVLRGWPGYQCPICTRQVGDFVAHVKDFEAAGAKVVMIYPGPADRLKAHAEEFFKDKALSDVFHVLIDPDFKFTNAYALRWDAPRETAYPSTFVIDRQNVVRFAKVSKTHGDRAPAADVVEVLSQIKQYKYTNHLAKEGSPYLQQHAHNPVDWYPWGPEAFEKAKKENEPIFLSIGYSTCHWCHVMEEESFSNPEIAKLLNDNFVSIKVDREERPDIDAVYMNFVQATTGSGGWPMTVFLTPDRKPFFGGTYFPPEDEGGMTGMKTLLPKVHDVWQKDQAKIVDSAEQVTAMLKKATSPAPDAAQAVGEAALGQGFGSIKAHFDPAHAGFGAAPKFPRPVTLNFLLHYQRRTGDKAALDMVLRTLRAMADGGMHDQLGGGFHRYSTDARWFLPHFEKMLYDQAQLANSYLDVYQITHDRFYAGTARDILNYVLRDMTGPDGQFFSAEDADSVIDPSGAQKKGEGAFYVWTADEIRAVIGRDDAAVFEYRFGVAEGGNVAADPRNEFRKKNVLSVAHSIDETAAKFGKTKPEVERLLDESKAKLLEARGHRPRPLRDDKTLVSWNGLMISAFARAGPVLEDDRYLRQAVRSATFVRDHLLDAKTNKLTRRWRDGHAEVDGFLDDYAFYIHGLLDLYESSLDVRWLKLALELQHSQDGLFWDAPAGGYFSTSGKDASVLMRIKDAEDNAEPSGNSVAALNLLRLSQMTDDHELRKRAEQTIRAFGPMIERAPSALPQMLVAVDFSLSKPKQIVLAGRMDGRDTRAMLRAVQSRYIPNRIILLADGGNGQKFLGQRVPLVATLTMIGDRATAYVCENFTCQLPTNDLAKLESMLGPSAATKPAP